MRESYAFVILKWKTDRLRRETGNPHLRSALDTGRDPKELFKSSIARPIKMLIYSPIVFLLSLYIAIVYGYLYLMFTTFPRVFEDQYGFSDGSVGLSYLGTGIGSFFGLVFCGAVSDHLVAHLVKRNGGAAKPEYRLPVMSIGALLVPAGLFLYGWTAETKEPWILPMLGSAIIGAGTFTIFVSCIALRPMRVGLTMIRCRPLLTWSMLIQSMLPRYRLRRLSFVRSLERCSLWRETTCTMLWV